MSGISKVGAERIQRSLLELAAQPGNGKHHVYHSAGNNPHSYLLGQMFVQIATLDTHDGPPITWGYLSGAYAW